MFHNLPFALIYNLLSMIRKINITFKLYCTLFLITKILVLHLLLQ